MLTTKLVDNAYELALENFDAAADVLGLDNDTREMIKYPERVLDGHCAGAHGRWAYPSL